MRLSSRRLPKDEDARSENEGVLSAVKQRGQREVRRSNTISAMNFPKKDFAKKIKKVQAQDLRVSQLERLDVEIVGKVRPSIMHAFEKEVTIQGLKAATGWVVENTRFTSTDKYNWEPRVSEDDFWYRNYFENDGMEAFCILN